MSIRSYLEAVESVLQNEFDKREDLIIFRPGVRRAYGQNDRDVALPNMGADSFAMAVGAAMTGMHAVLDLRSAADGAELLAEGFERMPHGAYMPVVILCMEYDAIEIPEELPVREFCPHSPRQAAGFMRAALHDRSMTMVILDEECMDMFDEVPDDAGFVMLPDDGEAYVSQSDQWEDVELADIRYETEYEEPCREPYGAQDDRLHEEEECAQQEYDMTEEAAVQETEAMQEAADTAQTVAEDTEIERDGEEAMQEEKTAVRKNGNEMNMCAVRTLCYDPTRLDALAAELNAARRVLIEKCVMCVYERFPDFECRCEEDAFEGECAFIPPEQANAALWIGRDRLSVTYDAAKMGHETAARLLRETCRLLRKPTLLIYDGEENG